MDTNRDSAHQSQNEDNFPIFSLGLEFLKEAKKEKTTEKESPRTITSDIVVCILRRIWCTIPRAML